jgi:hypothetical protein
MYPQAFPFIESPVEVKTGAGADILIAATGVLQLFSEDQYLVQSRAAGDA